MAHKMFQEFPTVSLDSLYPCTNDQGAKVLKNKNKQEATTTATTTTTTKPVQMPYTCLTDCRFALQTMAQIITSDTQARLDIAS